MCPERKSGIFTAGEEIENAQEFSYIDNIFDKKRGTGKKVIVL